MQRNVAARRAGEILPLLAALLLLALPARADTPRTIVLLASGLSPDDLRPGGPLPSVRALADAGAVGLLNTAVSGQATEAAAYLSVGAGERMAAPAGAARWVADVRASPEAAAKYRRRFGAPPPAGGRVHLELPALVRAQPAPSRAAQVGALGYALRAAGLRVATVGDWRAALVTVDRRGVVPQAAEPDVTVMVATDPAELDRLAADALPLVRSGAARVLLAVPAPPRLGGGWSRLGFVVAAGPGVAPGSLLTSPTTRTPGLAANVDLAPTVLAWHGAGTLPGSAGRALRTESAASSWAALASLDRSVIANRNATLPVALGYGTWAIGSALVAALLLWRGTKSRAVLLGARAAMLLSAAALLAFLPVGLLAPTNPAVYGLALLLCSAAVAGAAVLLARVVRVPTYAVLLLAAALLVCIDATRGAPLISRTLLSGYYLAGIRFYGIGNEYMGLTVGSALAGALLLPGRRARLVAALLLWPFVLLALGVPWWGADAGGALGATFTFGVAAFAARVPRLRARHLLTALAAAVVVTLAFALLDRLQPGAARSHVGAAVATGQARGLGALWEIVARKAAMNLRLTFTVWAFAAVAGLIPIWILLTRGPLAGRARRALAARPAFGRVGLPAALWGALAAVAFNDSGIVAGLLLLAAPITALLDAMLADAAAALPGGAETPPPA